RCVAVGKELSGYFAVSVGDRIDVISPVGGGMGPAGPLPMNRKFTVSAIFYSGMYEYDFGFLYMGLSEAQNFFSRENRVDAISITVDDMYRVEKQQNEIIDMLGDDSYDVKNWKTMNKNIFAALKMEKVVWFLIMGFVIIVASFNIISMLTMLVIEKNREISILKCMGMSNSSVMKIFMFDGVIIGLAGTVAGVVAGVVLCMILGGIELPFAKDVYYMTKIPVDMSLKTIFLVFVASMTVSFAATFYPAFKAAKINPAEGVRYD
ncbi:MAG: FtsX-like permease family protein, partial [bacterium]